METEENSYSEESEIKVKKAEKLEKISNDKLKGRVIIINPENSEFAKNLNLHKKGDYMQKTK